MSCTDDSSVGAFRSKTNVPRVPYKHDQQFVHVSTTIISLHRAVKEMKSSFYLAVR